MERFDAAGIDFAFPTQTLHLAGDDQLPLTVGQRWVSKDRDFSHSGYWTQAAALGAQTVLSNQASTSESVRPVAEKTSDSHSALDGELTKAPIEDDVMFGGGEDEAGEAQGEEAPTLIGESRPMFASLACSGNAGSSRAQAPP